MGRFAVLLCALVACNEVYDLDPTKLEPTRVIDDPDGDGVDATIDNCVTVANPGQADEDADTVGDACDNCPLVDNPDQADRGDDDGVGDRCDAHPISKGDCLIVFDSFAAPADFAARWSVVADPGATAMPADGHVTLVPGAPDRGIAVIAPELTGAFDVQLTGSAVLEVGAQLAVGSNLTGPRTGLVCGAGEHPTQRTAVLMQAHPQAAFSSSLGPVLGSALLLRMTHALVTGGRACRIDFGIARETLFISAAAPQSGGPGVVAFGSTAQVHGFAAYQQRPSCPEAIRR